MQWVHLPFYGPFPLNFVRSNSLLATDESDSESDDPFTDIDEDEGELEENEAVIKDDEDEGELEENEAVIEDDAAEEDPQVDSDSDNS